MWLLGADGNVNNKNNICTNTTTLVNPIPISLENSTSHYSPTNYYGVLDEDNFGILDSWATDSYLKTTAPMWKKQPHTWPNQSHNTQWQHITSSATATYNIATLPLDARTGFILPGLNKTLISVTKLCTAGCNISFSNEKYIVTYNGHVILEGICNNKNGSCHIPLLDKPYTANYAITCDAATKFANGVHQSTAMEETVKFLHQCLFSTTLVTLCKAINNRHLIGFPHITSALVQKYLPNSTATSKGHLNWTICS